MKFLLFYTAVFALVVVTIVDCSSHGRANGVSWSNIKNACIKSNKYKTVRGVPIESCKEMCEQERGCKSISYKTSGRICRFSRIGSESNYYTEPCYVDGYEYTEKLPTILSFDQFITKFNKYYGNKEEEAKRRAIFQENVKTIEENNKLHALGQSSFLMGVNEYSDMTYEEVIQKLTGLDVSDIAEDNKRSDFWYVPTDMGEEPASLDYREKGAINPIRNQKTCGSCWAFAVTSSIESNIFLRGGSLLQLSEQDLVDCSTGSCKGGWPQTTINHIINNGIAYRDEYPYTVSDGTCNEAASRTYNVKAQRRVRTGNENELLNALVHVGPISIAYYLSANFFSYRSGIFFDSECLDDNIVNHAMTLVGYGTENGEDYWLIRNSYGESWGDNGYIKVARNKDNHCWIASYAEIPLVEVTCPDGFTRVGSQCFMYVKEKKSWDDARSYCQEKSADLPQPIDLNAFQTFTSGETSSAHYSWLGARKEEGIFKWFNGTVAPVTGNHDVDDCVLYDGSHASWGTGDAIEVLGWNCSSDSGWFVCEAEAI